MFPPPASLESTLRILETALRVRGDDPEETASKKRRRSEDWTRTLERHNAAVDELLRDETFLAAVGERVQWGQGPEHFGRVLEAAVTYLDSEAPVLTASAVLAAARDLVIA